MCNGNWQPAVRILKCQKKNYNSFFLVTNYIQRRSLSLTNLWLVAVCIISEGWLLSRHCLIATRNVKISCSIHNYIKCLIPFAAKSTLTYILSVSLCARALVITCVVVFDITLNFVCISNTYLFVLERIMKLKFKKLLLI